MQIKFQFLCGFLSLFLGLGGCQWFSPRPELQPDSENLEGGAPLVEEKYRLSSDRQALESLRKEIPEEQKDRNDESALLALWMSEVKLTPAEVRSKFDSIYRKKREVFEKDLKKSREQFNKEQNKAKASFQKMAEDQKQDFKNKKISAADRKSMIDEANLARKEFFSQQKEKRDEFEFNIREKRKEFEDYLKSKRNEFDQEWRSYNKRYQDQKNLERQQKMDMNKK